MHLDVTRLTLWFNCWDHLLNTSVLEFWGELCSCGGKFRGNALNGKFICTHFRGFRRELTGDRSIIVPSGPCASAVDCEGLVTPGYTLNHVHPLCDGVWQGWCGCLSVTPSALYSCEGDTRQVAGESISYTRSAKLGGIIKQQCPVSLIREVDSKFNWGSYP